MKAKERPNILWICSDQQRYDTIGALGNSHVRTPNLNRLIHDGTAFSHAFCQSPICTPSRASFLTGMYPSTVHATLNGNDRWAGAAALLPKLLANAGYDTALVGKLHLAGMEGRFEPRGDDGYRHFRWSPVPRHDWPEGHAYADWLGDKGLDPAVVMADLDGIPSELHQSTWCGEETARLIKHGLGRPWFISVNPFDPHPLGHRFSPPATVLAGYDPNKLPGPLFRETDLTAQARLAGIDFQTEARRPDEFDGRQIQARYYAMVEMIDRMVGHILDALEQSGQIQNTLVVFCSDHGEALGDHGLLLKGCRFYEGLVRVPLIFSWPGNYQSGQVSDALVELVDIAPTLLEASGLSVPKSMQGRTLAALLAGSADPHIHRDFVRCEYYRSLNPNRPGLVGQFEGSYATMFRTRRDKLVTYHGHNFGELFDIEQDPGEFDNLWDLPEHAGRRWELTRSSFDALAFSLDLGTPQVRHF